jgi:inhibitor of KinA sporulation pathway (predicted exonuclease)
MAKRLDQVLVIDVEATCWEGAPPPGQENEIIEIGLCPIDVATGRRLAKESLLVRPERSRVSAFCTRLTTLTQEQVDGGIPFAEACDRLRRNYFGGLRTWASYGDYDRNQFERQCRSSGVKYPFGPTHLNVKNLFALFRGLHHEVGMAQALEMLGLPLEGTHHRAGDDAWNIAAVLLALLPSRPPA